MVLQGSMCVCQQPTGCQLDSSHVDVVGHVQSSPLLLLLLPAVPDAIHAGAQQCAQQQGIHWEQQHESSS
jgi:hypothetical protein